MVQTDIAQASSTCTEWRMRLRQLREQLNQCKEQLLEIVAETHTRESLTQVEHYHNQFHIQLINVHDLKHAIKQHEQEMHFEKERKGKVAHESLAKHEELSGQYQQLAVTIEQLIHDFSRFLRRKK